MGPASVREYDVAVIGAGPAGLTAAYLLTKEGRRTLVLEADPTYLGGISRTVTHNGFRFDIGGHRFFSKSAEVVALWKEILPEGMLERPRLSRVHYRGRLYSYPLRAFEALGNLGAAESARCVLSYLYWRAFPDPDPLSFRAWVTNRFGARLFEIFFRTYTEKVWGLACEEISADWAAQRIQGLDLWRTLRDALARSLGLARQRQPAIKTLIESFHYPVRGPGMMWEAAAARVLAEGGTIRQDARVTALRHDATTDRWTVVCRDSAGCETLHHARNVISSAPLAELVPAIEPRPVTADRARLLRYRDFLTVALILDAPDLFPDNWIYIPDPSVKVGRIQNFRSWSPGMVPDPRLACVGLEYFCFAGDGLWSMADAELASLAAAELEKLGLAARSAVVDAVVVRQEKAYPVYDDRYREHVAAIRDEIERRFPTLHLVGRNGMHRYNNQDHAMMTAMLAVRNILAGERRYDLWAVNEDAEYHEEGTRGQCAALNSERLVPLPIAGRAVAR
jgi:protoporphyrinogen oxidase